MQSDASGKQQALMAVFILRTDFRHITSPPHETTFERTSK